MTGDAGRAGRDGGEFAAPARRGTDGLTAAELRRGRDDWWNAGFTRALLESLPEEVTTLVEVGCGLGRAGREMLARVPRLSYLGVDLDGGRLAAAGREFGAGPLAERARFVVGRAEDLPLPAGGVEALLFCMTLQHVDSPLAALREAHRVLRPGGTLVAAEPDTLAERWFFDGPLFQVTDAFRALLSRCRQARSPRDLAIGARVAGLARTAGFVDIDLSVHAIFETRSDSARACAARWQEMSQLIARACGLAETAPEARACRDVIDDWLASGDPERSGSCGTTVPAFITVARRPG